MEITWLTQGGFVFEQDGERLAVDPYLSDFVEQTDGLKRLCPAPVPVNKLSPAAVFCTHHHPDHLDPVAIPQIAQRWPACLFAGPFAAMQRCRQLGVDPQRLRTVGCGESLTVGPFALKAVIAHHGQTEAVGLLVEAEGGLVYVSGDSEYHEELAEDVSVEADRRIDLVLICINGRWGNMSGDEALKVVGQLKPVAASPMHYGLFAENTADPKPFVRGCLAMGVRSAALTAGRATPIAELTGSQT
ncbi:MAG: MBL fold metallo-hydrolase [Phycisphaerae bacterium]|nr:MBL fold metallo-hydrolase [Phycisphaerae bacterium]